MRITQILLLLAITVFSYNVTVLVPDRCLYMLNGKDTTGPGTYTYTIKSVSIQTSYLSITIRSTSNFKYIVKNDTDTVNTSKIVIPYTKADSLKHDTVVAVYDTMPTTGSELVLPTKIKDNTPIIYYDIAGRRITSINKHGRYFARKIKLIQLK